MTKSVKKAKRTARMKGRARGGASVACPRDGKTSEVLITRRDPLDPSVVERTRRCKVCRHKFQTYESTTQPGE